MVGFCRVFSVDFRKILLRFQFKKDIIVLSNLCFMDVGCWMYFGLELVQKTNLGLKKMWLLRLSPGIFSGWGYLSLLTAKWDGLLAVWPCIMAPQVQLLTQIQD